MDTFFRDLRYAVRQLIKSPGFTAVALLSIALGIGANTTVFSVINAVLLRSLPYKDPSSLVLLWGDSKQEDGRRKHYQVSATDVADFRSQASVFEDVATYGNWNATMSGDGEAERVPAIQVGDGFFKIMKGTPLLGRVFTPEEQVDGKDFVIVLSYGLWQRRFGGDPNIIGKTTSLSGRPYNVVGVMAADFHPLPSTLVYPEGQFYRPVAEAYVDLDRDSRHLRAIARLKPGVTIEQAQTEASTIAQRLERSEQTILFLNRRGYSSALECPLCGYVAGCPNCSLALTYHRRDQKLSCHICGHTAEAPRVCPDKTCRNAAIRYSGLGTQKVEETLEKLFPHARIKRMDSDALKRKDDYRRILGDFRIGKLDSLVGTQMIAKGLHFPNVTLVGIIHADLSLHMPDFRAGERTFQLLTQVAGRAGRGDVEGEVIVQAFTPFHPAIQYARRHDYAGFYEQEIEFREQLKYPPVSRACMLTVRGRNEEKVRFSTEHLRREVDKHLAEFKDLVIAGPAPAPLARAESNYRFQIMLRTRQMPKLSRVLSKITEKFELPDEVYLAVDIDPVNLS